MLNRRQFVAGFGLVTAGGTGLSGYAIAEPFQLKVTRYALDPPGWPPGLKLRLAVLADIHACEPWMSSEHIGEIVARTNALRPDITLLLGDFVAGDQLARWGRALGEDEWLAPLTNLAAPLGVHAVLGNHDWWADRRAQKVRRGPVRVRTLLEGAGISVYENDAVRLAKDGAPFWLAGLGDQWAFWSRRKTISYRSGVPYEGVDDLAGTLSKVNDPAPVILMAHEPDIFPDVPRRVALMLSGHTHGGQVRLLGFAPVVPSRYGQRYVYGHIREDGRDLIVSGGLGCSALPVRFGSPPEIVLVELGTFAA